MSNFIKLNRKLKDKAFYIKDSEKVHLWIHLLLSANWTEKEEILGGKPYLCKCGQFTTGRKQLSEQTGINESKIERILTYFEKTEQQIEQQKTSTNRLISITNWVNYQITEQQFKQRVNNNRTTSEQQPNNNRTHYKNKEEYKEVKNIIYNEFYDFEIENSNNDINYIQFVKILFGENNSGLKLNGVLSLKNQVTFKQFQLVFQEKKKNNVSLTTILENLENRPDLLRKYSMLQRVLLNWMKTNKK